MPLHLFTPYDYSRLSRIITNIYPHPLFPTYSPRYISIPIPQPQVSYIQVPILLTQRRHPPHRLQHPRVTHIVHRPGYRPRVDRHMGPIYEERGHQHEYHETQDGNADPRAHDLRLVGLDEAEGHVGERDRQEELTEDCGEGEDAEVEVPLTDCRVDPVEGIGGRREEDRPFSREVVVGELQVRRHNGDGAEDHFHASTDDNPKCCEEKVDAEALTVHKAFKSRVP
ncbi:hypothetical protein VM1G_05564 [Cytospora mali]|uniref:Uncharacterized protein n=1 Tax=Cytospora mali TaxID=578113 RepID=A0A194VZF9_CYTMA|nr:hypothetical protein VM1G_05564 [Valsa mali]